MLHMLTTNGRSSIANSCEFVTVRPQVRWSSSASSSSSSSTPETPGSEKAPEGTSTALVVAPVTAVVVPADVPVDLEYFFQQNKKDIADIQAHYRAKVREEQKEMAQKIAMFPWKVLIFPVNATIKIGKWAHRKITGEGKGKTDQEKEDKDKYDTAITRYFQGQDVCRNLKVEECVFEKGTHSKEFSEMVGKNYIRFTKGLSEWLPNLSFVIAPTPERAPIDDERSVKAAALVAGPAGWHLNPNNGVITVRDNVGEDTFEDILYKIGPQANSIRKALERNSEETVKLQMDVLDRVKLEKLESSGVEPVVYHAALHTILQAPWYFRKHLKHTAVKLDAKAVNPAVDKANLIVILPAQLQRHCMHTRYQKYRRYEAILKACKPYRYVVFLLFIWLVGDVDF